MNDRPFPTRRHNHQRRRDRGGFSLVELLVVIGIIVLIAASSVPAFRYITGARSTESAANLASAMVSRARNQAVADHRGTGVFFFLDPLTDKTTMALVAQDGDRLADPEFVAYKGWTNGSGAEINPRTAGFTNTGVTYYQQNGTQDASFVMNLTKSLPAETYHGSYVKLSSQGYHAKVTHTPLAANEPPSSSWGLSQPLFLELVKDTDFQALPPGVAAQVMIDPTRFGGPNPFANFDRYLRTGVLLFDRDGQFVNTGWAVGQNSQLAFALNPANGGSPLAGDLRVTRTVTVGGTPTTVDVLTSGYGLVLYDREIFRSTTVDPNNATFKASEGDFIFRGKFTLSQGSDPTNNYNTGERREENWLDQNSLPLMVNRFTGTLIRGE